jgi:hypothetical protein
MAKRGVGLSAAYYVMHTIITSNVGITAKRQYSAGEANNEKMRTKPFSLHGSI